MELNFPPNSNCPSCRAFSSVSYDNFVSFISFISIISPVGQARFSLSLSEMNTHVLYSRVEFLKVKIFVVQVVEQTVESGKLLQECNVFPKLLYTNRCEVETIYEISFIVSLDSEFLPSCVCCCQFSPVLH